MDKTKKLKNILIGSGGILSFILLWEIIARIVVNDKFLLPSFSEVILSFMKIDQYLLPDLGGSLYHFILGLGFAVIIGCSLGAITGWFRGLDSFFRPLIELLRPIPPLAWIPFAIAWFKLTDFSSAFIIFIGSLFPILINAYYGFRDTPIIYKEAAIVLGQKKKLGLLTKIGFPSALPSMLYGIKVAIGIGWMCMVAAEIFGRSEGLGFRLWNFYQLHQMDYVVAYMLILGVIGILMDYAFRYFLIDKLVRWKKELAIK